MSAHSNQYVALRKLILAAFPKTDPPSDGNVTSHVCKECQAVADDFRSVRWWSAKDELIDSNYDKLPLFTPEAYRYYLPAFLLRALDSFEPENSVLEFCLYALGCEPTRSDDPRYRARFESFTGPQLQAVTNFLECIGNDETFRAHRDDVETALNKLEQLAKDEGAS
jgi:hypothetical protein